MQGDCLPAAPGRLTTFEPAADLTGRMSNGCGRPGLTLLGDDAVIFGKHVVRDHQHVRRNAAHVSPAFQPIGKAADRFVDGVKLYLFQQRCSNNSACFSFCQLGGDMAIFGDDLRDEFVQLHALDAVLAPLL